MGRNFPIKIFVCSTVFWISLLIVCYFTYIYTTLYLEIRDETDLETLCTSFQTSGQKNNIEKVLNYPMGEAEPYLISYGIKPGDLKSVTPVEQPLPFIVTGVTSSQFYQVQGLVRHINEELRQVNDINLVIYDIGLTEEQRILIRDQCQCVVRKFTYEFYPEHVQALNFAWRPLIIQTILKETKSVIFIEPTTRFKSAASLNMFRNPGIRQFYLWDEPSISVVGYTHPKTFESFREDRCAFSESKMISTEIMAFYNSESTWRTIIRPWVVCALNKDCVSPEGARSNYCFHLRHPKTTGCHHFDQSALSIIANRAYQLTSNRNKNIPPKVTYFTEVEEKYFAEQPTSYLFWFCCVLILTLIAYKSGLRRRILGRIVHISTRH